MPTAFASRLKSLGFSLPEWCRPPTERLVRAYEAHFGLTLPDDYREFLVRHGGACGSAICTFQEPTPFGMTTSIDEFYGFPKTDDRDGVAEATELIEGAPDVVALAGNVNGGMFWLKCTGSDCGHVYYHDPEGRSAWPDKTFRARYPNLAPVVAEYLSLRKAGKLPKKPPGYEHVYRLSTSFREFIDRLEKPE